MKTLRVTLSDIVGGTGGSGSTAVVHARYVTANGRGRDVHLTDGTIVVPVRRSVTPGTDPEVFDFTVIPSDDGDVREADRDFLTEVSWTVTAPEGGKAHGVRRVLVPSTADAVVQLGLLSTPIAMPTVSATVIDGGNASAAGYVIRPRRDTTLGWAATNPVLALGEIGFDTDTGEVRVGNGVNQWSDLPDGMVNAYSIAVANGFVGDEAAWLASLVGPVGPVSTTPGPPGPPGPPNVLAVGTVTTGAAGTSAAATITGASPVQTLNLTIPRGNTGSPTEFELRGTGSPEGVVTAPVGTYYTDTAGTNGAWRWRKATGTGNTGWVLESGDTGTRNIASRVTDSTKFYLDWGHTAIIRRIGQVVYLAFWVPSKPRPGAVNVNMVNFIPPGFNPTGGYPMSSIDVYENAAGLFKSAYISDELTGDTNLNQNVTGIADGSAWSCTGSYVTDEPWPTSLPGTAV